MGNSDQAVDPTLTRIDWRKLMAPSLLMVLPTVTAIVLDKWLGFFPFITIVAILICFPVGAIWVTKAAMGEMDRVIAVVAPKTPPESPDTRGSLDTEELLAEQDEASQSAALSPQLEAERESPSAP